MFRNNPAELMPFVVPPRAETVHEFSSNQKINSRLQSGFVQDPKRKARALKILQVMPPGKHFGPARATSIDLDTYDLMRFSGFRDDIIVLADPVDTFFDEVSVACYQDRCSVKDVMRIARQAEVDVIVAQQRLPLAGLIARALPGIPLVLRLHNLQKSFNNRFPLERHIRRTFRHRLYNRLAGIVHVSKTCQTDFDLKWPEVRVPSCVIGNGLDFSEWAPSRKRAPEVLLVARCVPEKGVLEAVEGMANVLPQFPGWRGHVILSSVDEKPAYAARVFRLLENHRDIFRVEINRPFTQVKAANERAAIAVVPSKWVEPFGRAALEAHAGGAALISSGTGGLSEISGETALMLPDVSPETIETALRRLLTDDAQRAQLARAGATRARELFDIRTQAAAMDQFLERIALDKAGERWSGTTQEKQ